MSRATIKNAIQNQITTRVSGLTVFAGRPNRIPAQYMPAAVLMLPRAREDRRSTGIKWITYDAALYVYNLVDLSQEAESRQTDFDALLDNIDAALRADKSLGGVAIKSAEQIETTIEEPKEDQQTLVLFAAKTFEVVEAVQA